MFLEVWGVEGSMGSGIGSAQSVGTMQVAETVTERGGLGGLASTRKPDLHGGRAVVSPVASERRQGGGRLRPARAPPPPGKRGQLGQ